MSEDAKIIREALESFGACNWDRLYGQGVTKEYARSVGSEVAAALSALDSLERERERLRGLVEDAAEYADEIRVHFSCNHEPDDGSDDPCDGDDCRRCSAAALHARLTAEAKLEAPGKLECPNCGHEVQPHWCFCANCAENGPALPVFPPEADDVDAETGTADDQHPIMGMLSAMSPEQRREFVDRFNSLTGPEAIAMAKIGKALMTDELLDQMAGLLSDEEIDEMNAEAERAQSPALATPCPCAERAERAEATLRKVAKSEDWMYARIFVARLDGHERRKVKDA